MCLVACKNQSCFVELWSCDLPGIRQAALGHLACWWLGWLSQKAAGAGCVHTLWLHMICGRRLRAVAAAVRSEDEDGAGSRRWQPHSGLGLRRHRQRNKAAGTCLTVGRQLLLLPTMAILPSRQQDRPWCLGPRGRCCGVRVWVSYLNPAPPMLIWI